MTYVHSWLGSGVLGLTLVTALLSTSVQGLQCYGCNIIQGQRYVDVGCSNPEVLTCSHSHKGFKHRFCIRTESTPSALSPPPPNGGFLSIGSGYNTPGHFPGDKSDSRSSPVPVRRTGLEDRHCQQQELPGVRIHCCGSDLCNSATRWRPNTLQYICALACLLLLRLWL
ncbi:hypothetical protein NHX12_028089 [Muraenolepis orangiensis]|uniref:Uncharacterized protein n=1 Tax=Muraenolepis orangiensis TaxID=630683 RepID=A0A9Q0EHT6_9TELE|nr:hypothetical protein NHX12_028089 [Muraenolepis orangiensis]